MTSLVTIGRVVKAHGLRGEVAVHLMTDVPDRFAPGTSMFVGGTATTVVSSRPHQSRMLVIFEGISDRTAAESLRGQMIQAEPIDVADWETYFVHELVGARVEHEGVGLGEVVAIIELPSAAAYDLLEVRRDDGSTWMLPAVDEYVEVVEADDGSALRLVVVDPPEGLIETDQAEIADAAGGNEATP
ncbi:MAG: ribosome maturation factor RimM [Nitriliruptoraceae bacterium]